MRRLTLLLVLFAAALPAAVVQGVVLDDETGNPLARSQITLLPLPGARTAGSAVSLRNTERGAFSILSVQPGWYVLRVSRRGFATAEAGQLRAGRPGSPFEVTAEDRPTFFQIRMTRLAAVTGSVLDDNAIGIPDWPVHIYTARKPVRRVTEVATDDRGVFRIGGLEPGMYVLRSGPGNLDDDGTLLPTYFKYGTRLENSEPVRLKLGQTATDVVIRPTRGRLFTVAGMLNAPGDRAARLTLITDTGRRVIASVTPPNTSAPFEASGIPPGPIELFVEGPGCGGYARLILNNDSTSQRIGCTILQKPVIEWRVDDRSAQLQYPIAMRRADLDGLGPLVPFSPNEPIMPGHWELQVQTGPSHYATGIRVNGPLSTSEDGWFAVDIGYGQRITINLSSRPAGVTGQVVTSGKPVTGAVVYMELYNPELPSPRLRLFSTRTDAQGGFAFAGLAPGRYRLLSTFDFDIDDAYAMDRAVPLVVREGDQPSQMVELILP